jgi:membrane protease YdiL (CAAX protease family)
MKKSLETKILKEKLNKILKYYIFLMIFTILQKIFEEYYLINTNIKSKLETDYLNTPIELFFIVVIFAPFIEEIIFRLPLEKTYYFIISILFSLLFFKGFNETNIIISTLIIGFSISITCFQIFPQKSILKRILIFISVLTFTLVHINNYSFNELKLMSIFELILLFLPQLLLGIFTTKLRVNSKIYYPILLHSAYNATIISLHFLNIKQ